MTDTVYTLVIPSYPVTGNIVRGEPLVIKIDISINGTAQDVSTWTWRAHIRRSADAALLFPFTISTTTPPSGSVPSRLLLTLTAEQTAQLKTGMGWDLEQLTPTQRTHVICTKLIVTKDYSHA